MASVTDGGALQVGVRTVFPRCNQQARRADSETGILIVVAEIAISDSARRVSITYYDLARRSARSTPNDPYQPRRA